MNSHLTILYDKMTKRQEREREREREREGRGRERERKRCGKKKEVLFFR